MSKHQPTHDFDFKKVKNIEVGYKRFWFGKLIIPIFLIVFATIFGQNLIEQINRKPKKSIILGFTEYSLLGSQAQKKQLQETFEAEANKLLGEVGDDYLIITKVISGGYDEIFRALHVGRIDIAFVPPYTWIEANFTAEKTIDTFEVIGFKYPNEGLWYYTGFLSSSNTPRNLENTFILNKELKSTSTNVIPTYYLLGGLKIRPDSVERFSRVEMFENLTSGDTLSVRSPIIKDKVGFFQSDQWAIYNNYKLQKTPLGDMLREKTEQLKYTRIESIPIPYDVAISRKNYLEELSKTDCIDLYGHIKNWFCREKPGSAVLNSLRGLIYSPDNLRDSLKKEWFKNNQEFTRFVLSGVVTSPRNHTTDKIHYAYLNDKVHRELFDKNKAVIYSLNSFGPNKDSLFSLKHPFALNPIDTIDFCNKSSRLDTNLNVRRGHITTSQSKNFYASQQEKADPIFLVVPTSINGRLEELKKWKPKGPKPALLCPCCRILFTLMVIALIYFLIKYLPKNMQSWFNRISLRSKGVELHEADYTIVLKENKALNYTATVTQNPTSSKDSPN